MPSCKVRRDKETREIQNVLVDRPFDTAMRDLISSYMSQKLGQQVVIDSAEMERVLRLRGFRGLSPEIIGINGVTNLKDQEERIANLNIAKEMQVKGMSKNDIWIATNWEYNNTEQLWKTETNYGVLSSNLQEGVYRLEDVFQGEVLEAYPQIVEYEVHITNLPPFIDGISQDNKILINKNLSEIDRLTTITHEITHHIQVFEGFRGGRNPNEIFERLLEMYMEDSKKEPTEEEKIHLQSLSETIYNRWSGEVEARNSASRLYMDELQRGFSTISSTEDTPRILKYYSLPLPPFEFLKTSQGDVYGFVDNATNIIYLDPKKGLTATLLHEGSHVWQKAVLAASKNGDKKAQEIVARRNSIVDPIVDSIVRSKKGLTNNTNQDFHIIGQRGANSLPKLMSKLDVASEMFDNGKSNEEIWITTGWFRDSDGEWKTELEYGNLNPTLPDELLSTPLLTVNLGGLYNAEVLDLYPELRDMEVVFQLMEEDILGATNGNQIVVNSTLSREDKERVIVHEVQHLVQRKEGFITGQNVEVIEEVLNYNFENLYNRKPNENEKNKIRQSANNFYQRWSGEVEARNASERSTLSTEERNRLTLEATRDIEPIFQIRTDKSFFENLFNTTNYQIKSATGNAGTFSNTTGNIDFSIIDSQRATADELQKLEIAKQLQEQGVSNEGIWITTGWEFDTAQKRWVQEIPTNLSIKFNIQEQTGTYNLEDVVDFPELFERFPEYKNIKVEIENDNKYGTIAYFDGRETININKNLLREANSDSSKSFNSTANRQTLSHEIQHVISSTLSFEGGITPFGIQVAIGQDKRGNRLPGKRFERISELVSNRFGEEWRQTASLEALVDFSEELYLNSAGELQAYNVQDRMLLTLEDLSTTPPSSTQRSQTPTNLDLSIMGEQGASNLADSVERLRNLQVAKSLREKGINTEDIWTITGWQYDTVENNWKTEVTDSPINPLLDLSSVQDQLKDSSFMEMRIPLNIIYSSPIFEAYPQLNDTELVFRNGLNGVAATVRGENIIYVDPTTTLEELRKSLLHELHHKISEIEGFAEGTSSNRILEEYISEYVRENDEGTITEPLFREMVQRSKDTYFYNNGEFLARVVEERSDLSEEERITTPLISEMNEDDRRYYTNILPTLTNKNSDFLIQNLSSEAYNRREGETLEQYKDRLREEVFARMIGDNAPQYLQDLGLDKKEVKSFLQRVSEFIDFFVEWLQGKQGFKDMSRRDIEKLSVRDFLQKATTSQLLGEYSVDIINNSRINEQSIENTSEQYFGRNADRLPLTLSVFNRPEFKAMQGKMINPITVLNSLNQSGIKQIEKDLIKQIIQDNYQGQKKISYDELEATVRANIIPLERIFTSSYADYGMNNLGDGNYGEANTIILNSPIEHGVTGHFSGDFKASGRKNIKYVPKQQNEQTINRLPEEAEQGRIIAGSFATSATAISQGVLKENSDIDVNGEKAQDLQTEALKKHAKENNYWFEEDYKYGEQTQGGQEAKVYLNPNTVTKVINPFMFSSTPLEFLDRVAIFNSVFPSTAIKIMGVTEDFTIENGTKGDIRFVLSQPKINVDESSPLTSEEIKEFMDTLGFKEEESSVFTNDKYVLDDLNTSNVVRDTNGNIFVIDADARLNTPNENYGGTQSFRDQEPSPIIPEQIESQTYKQLLSIPGITQEEALTMYKQLYSTNTVDWRNIDTLNCE